MTPDDNNHRHCSNPVDSTLEHIAELSVGHATMSRFCEHDIAGHKRAQQ
jgi:hypothetical protein